MDRKVNSNRDLDNESDSLEGLSLVDKITEISGLEKSEMSLLLNEILFDSRKSIETLTLDELRIAMVDYLNGVMEKPTLH